MHIKTKNETIVEESDTMSEAPYSLDKKNKQIKLTQKLKHAYRKLTEKLMQLYHLANNNNRYINIYSGLLVIMFLLISFSHVDLYILFFKLILTHKMHPIAELNDGIGYFLESQAFYHFNLGSLGAYFWHNKFFPYGHIMHGGAHGIFYSVLYGTLAKFLGNPIALIPIANLIFVILTMIICLWLFKTLEQRLLSILLIISYPIVIVNQFNYMQEMIHLFFAAIFFAITLKSHSKHKLELPITQIIFSLFRPIYLLCSAPIVLFYPKRTIYFRLTLFCVIFIVSAISAAAYLHFFFAPYPLSFVHNFILKLQAGDYIPAVKMIIEHQFSNIKHLLTIHDPDKPYKISQLSIFVTIVGTYYYGFKNKNITLKYAGAISALAYLWCISTYDFFDWRDVRVLTFFYFYCGFLLIQYKKYIIPTACVVMFIIVFPSSFSVSKNFLLLSSREPVSTEQMRENHTIKKYNCVIISGSQLNYKLPSHNSKGPIYYYFRLVPEQLGDKLFYPCSAPPLTKKLPKSDN